MQESLLHYIWQFQYFDRAALSTTAGESISIFNPGFRNTHAGPDFSNARIKIGDIEWVGNVEIHIQSSGWEDHKHDTDPAYENVVLHVVWKNDSDIRRKDQSALPTLELQGKVDNDLLLKCNKLLSNPETIPCAPSILSVREITRLSMLEKALMQRLENKASNALTILAHNNNDWEETCYQMLCKNFGFKVNADPFFQLAQKLPYKIIMKHADKLIQLEALLFGQSGFLDDHYDNTYYQLLQREYTLLAQKFNLHPNKLNKAQWKFLRLRPANFPTLRLAQLASLLHHQKNIFSKFLEAGTYKELEKILTTVQSEYWQHHYQFDADAKEHVPAMGKMSTDNIIINTVVPLLVAYGKAKDEQRFIDTAVNALTHIDPEHNTITKTWNELGITNKTAFDSQAIIELHNNFCLRRKCLDCNIGASLLRPAVV